MSKAEYQICIRCVMDTSDSFIFFNEEGICSHCISAEFALAARKLEANHWTLLKDEAKTVGKKKGYDCIIGLSGGIDSSYVALKAVEMGLKPLAVHVDAGWNTEAGVSNVYELVNKLDIPLETIVIDWNEVRSIQIAYLKSGVMNQDVPQDHAFFAALYKTALKKRVNSVITGSNLASESILPKSWGHDAMDGKQVKDIARRFGAFKVKQFPIITLPKYYARYMFMGRFKIYSPLDDIPYSKDQAVRELSAQFNWRDYGGKHRESQFTSFHQHVYLPNRFGIDKRKAHLSSLIVSKQISRHMAMDELRKDALSNLEKKQLVAYVASKLDISESKLEEYSNMPYVDHLVYKNDQKWIKDLLDNQVARYAKNLIINRAK
jgi:N-acetyl sugar amidotransferase